MAIARNFLTEDLARPTSRSQKVRKATDRPEVIEANYNSGLSWKGHSSSAIWHVCAEFATCVELALPTCCDGTIMAKTDDRMTEGKTVLA